MNNKKILITCLYPSEANPLFAIEIAKSIKRLDFDVYALIEKSTINKVEWLELLGSERVDEININNVTRRLKKYTKYLNAARYSLFSGEALFKKIKGLEFDCVLYTFYHHWNDILIKKIDSKRNVLFLHDPIPHSGEAKKRLNNQKHQVSLMDDVVLLSKKFIPIVEKEYGISTNKIHFMPHGAMDYSKEDNIEPVKLDEKKGIHFLFFGRITEYKGVDVLLKAFRDVSEKHPEATLTIAGNGEFSKYKQFIRGNEEIINRYIDDSEIPGLFSRTNTIIVLPYIDATQSGVIPIAAQYGNPVIASNTGGLVEQLDEGNVGIFVEPNNTNSLLEAMETAIKDRKLLAVQSKAMLAYHDKLDWSIIVSNLMSELRKKD